MLNLDLPRTLLCPPTAELAVMRRRGPCPPPAEMITQALRANRHLNAMRRVARHWPNTGAISVQAARFVTTLIPDTNRQPLLYRALHAAVHHTLACILAHPGRALDAESLRTFVLHLFRPLTLVLQYEVRNAANDTWDPAEVDLYAWLQGHENLVISHHLDPPDPLQLTRFYAALTARLLDPADLRAMTLTAPALIDLLHAVPDPPPARPWAERLATG